MEQCNTCHQFKPLGDFGLNRSYRVKNCKDCCREIAARYRKLYPERTRAAIQKYLGNKDNLKRHRQRAKIWRLNNPQKAKDSSKNWYNRPKNRMAASLSTMLTASLRYNVSASKVWDVVGYNYDEFKRHMENLFREGMNWQNHGEWEMDHIIPQCFFKFNSTSDVEFKMCWRLENIQPLWDTENKHKSSKVLMRN